MGSRDAGESRSWGVPLAGLAIAYGFFHHVGTLLRPLGEIGDTRWADWIDMLTPYAIVGLAGWVLSRVQASKTKWAVFGLGAVVYVQGHGVHLAANSIGNVEKSDVAHFWDEFMGHYVWYAGLALIVGVLAAALVGEPRPRWLPVAFGLAALAGLTHFTNSIEGQFAWPGLAIAAVFAAWGWRTRERAGVLLLATYGLSLALFITFGIWQRGFPEFSELGWI